MSQTNYTELSAKINKLKRRPTIESVFMLWQDEISSVLEQSTANKINKIFTAHVLTEDRESIRIDRLNPLLAQKIFLDKPLSEQKIYNRLQHMHAAICHVQLCSCSRNNLQ